MAQRSNRDKLDIGEDTATRGSFDPAGDTDDTVTEEQLDRLEAMTGGADNTGAKKPNRNPAVDREMDKLAASTEEEVDALRVNLAQDAEFRDSRDGSGKIVDEVAQEQMAGLTESGKELDDRGVNAVAPGRDDTSSVIRQHHPNTGLARAQDVVEGNVDEPRNETMSERRVDEGTAA